jgi:hypothetical protein
LNKLVNSELLQVLKYVEIDLSRKVEFLFELVEIATLGRDGLTGKDFFIARTFSAVQVLMLFVEIQWAAAILGVV